MSTRYRDPSHHGFLTFGACSFDAYASALADWFDDCVARNWLWQSFLGSVFGIPHLLWRRSDIRVALLAMFLGLAEVRSGIQSEQQMKKQNSFRFEVRQNEGGDDGR